MSDRPTVVTKYHPLKHNSTQPRKVESWHEMLCVSGAVMYMRLDTGKAVCAVTLEPDTWGSSTYHVYEIEGDHELAESLLAKLQ